MKQKCFCVDKQADERKCGCGYHLKMDSLVSGLKSWRRAIRTCVKVADPEHTCEHCQSFEEYLVPLSSLNKFGDHLCPCSRHANGRRHLHCSSGFCRHFNRPFDNLVKCSKELEVAQQKDVKFKWLRPIKIGNRNEEEWVWETKPYEEFMKLMITYYVSRRPLNERELIFWTPIATSVRTPGIASTIAKPMACPKCGTFEKSGRNSCCAPGGAWFKNCGGVLSKNVDHTWVEGVVACKSKFKAKAMLSTTLFYRPNNGCSANEFFSLCVLTNTHETTCRHDYDDSRRFRMPQLRHPREIRQK